MKKMKKRFPWKGLLLAISGTASGQFMGYGIVRDVRWVFIVGCAWLALAIGYVVGDAMGYRRALHEVAGVIK